MHFSGRRPLPPFDSFAPTTTVVLTLAQQKANTSGRPAICSQDILLGLLEEESGRAAKVLGLLRVELDTAKGLVATMADRDEREVVIEQDGFPGSRTRRIIFAALEESRSMGVTKVMPEHLLIALLLERECIAADVLSDLGVTLDGVRRELRTLPGYQ